MKRTWTKESAREWRKRRDEFREQRGLVSIEQLKNSQDKKGRGLYEDIMKLERDKILERLQSYSQETVSWQVSALVSHTPRETRRIVVNSGSYCTNVSSRCKSTRLYPSQRLSQASYAFRSITIRVTGRRRYCRFDLRAWVIL